ncbi:Sphingomyelin phosphodiesterase [Sulfidibacter corallicola]
MRRIHRLFSHLGFPGVATVPGISTLLLVLGLSWVPARGESYVYIQNDSPQTVTLEISVRGGLTQGKHWDRMCSELEPWQKATPVLWFNRDEGIKWGRDFYFETKVVCDGRVLATLRQKLHGNWIGSSLYHSADDLDWFSDRDVHLSDSSAGVQTLFKSAYTGWYDDLVYVVHAEEVYDHLRHLATDVPDQLTLLAYNLQLLPTSIQWIDQGLRARYMGEALDGFDAIVFSEAFDDDVRGFDEAGNTGDPDSLWEHIRHMYPYRTDIVGKDEGLEQDGGVFIASRWPILHQEDLVYDESVCEASDCLSEKGVMYARIEKSLDGMSRTYHLFGSHLQADYPGDDNSHVRASQLNELRRFVDALGIPADEPVIMAGDFNVDLDSGEYPQMLDRLNAADPERAEYGFPYSLDGFTNAMADPDSEWMLDYVLVDRSHRMPRFGETAVLVLRSPAPEMMAKSAGQRRQDMHVLGNYSDHYPVFAYFDFSD